MAIIGIDLGTTNCAMAYLKDGKPEIIPNKDGERTTPSIFSLDPHGEIKIGRAGKNLYTGNPDNTVLEVKRLMGSDEKVTVGEKEYSPEEISSFYLKYLKESAEIFLGEKVTEAIITVPAYFSDSQRKATQIAGRIAGLKVERVINEPTAAAISYGLDNMDEDTTVMIYDLGGGTFDVSITELFSGIVQVKSSTGDNELGGMDFDERLVQWLVKQVERKHEFDILNSGSKAECDQRYARVRVEAEKVKIELSTNNTAMFNLPFIAVHNGMPISITEEITRAEFETLISDLVSSTINKVEKALEEANLKVEDIHEVILVGGSTRIPLVQEVIEEKMRKKARKNINPDEAVALGAAIQGAIKTGEISSDKGLMVIDVCPYALGTDVTKVIGGEDIPGFFDTIIEANQPIPAKNTKIYYTNSDDQEIVNIYVFQGNPDTVYVEDAIAIAQEPITLTDIPKGTRGSQSISITFEYDINGMLNVSAEILSTGKKITSAINTQTGVMSEAEIKAATTRVEGNWAASQMYVDVKPVITRAERLLPDLDSASRQQMESILNNLKNALSQNNEMQVRKYEDELTDILIELV